MHVLNVVTFQKVWKNLSIIQDVEPWHTNTAAEKDEAVSVFTEGKGELSMKPTATGGSFKSDFDGKNNWSWLHKIHQNK